MTAAALTLYSDAKSSAEEVRKFSAKDAAQYVEFQESLARVAGIAAQLLELTPPVIEKPSKEDLWKLLKIGRKVRGLGKKEMMRLIRWGPMAAADFVAEFFETDLLRGGNRGAGNFRRRARPMVRRFHRAVAAARGGGPVSRWEFGPSAWRHGRADCRHGRRGQGSGSRNSYRRGSRADSGDARTSDRRRACERRGNPGEGRGFGRRSATHFARPARSRASAAQLCGEDAELPLHGTAAKVNIALDALPVFTALKNSSDANAALAGRIHIGPGIDYLERAFDDSKYGEFSRAPYLDISIPSILDNSLAPAGKHVMSIYMQFAPYKLRSGDWTQQRDSLRDAVINTLSEYAPDLPSKILAAQTLTPLDLENIYGLTGGHPFHGELALDQIFTMRPILGWARYATPVKGLYLCGNGTHPGNGVTGASGHNAAREILKHLR